MIIKNRISGSLIYLQSLSDENITQDYIQWLNDSHINRFMETRHQPWSFFDIQEYLKEQNNSEDQLLLGIFLNSDVHIGNIKLGPINLRHKLASVSLFIGQTENHKKGYATEAIRLTKDYAFNILGLQKLSAGMYADNIGSLKSFLKAGFCLEGILKSHYTLSDMARTDLFQVGCVAQ